MECDTVLLNVCEGQNLAVLPSLKDWLKQSPYTLCLSSGFFGFFAHAGFVTALAEADLEPEVISGASAGALTGATWGAGVDPVTFRTELSRLRREDFWDPGFGLGLLKGKLFDEILTELLPVTKLENHRIDTRVSAFDILKRRTHVFSSGPNSAIIRASCAVPVMFQPVWIGRRPYLDGGILDRPGMQTIPPATRTLYHHLPPTNGPRGTSAAAYNIPQRSSTVAIAINDLPFVGPALMDNGASAFDMAYQRVKDFLNKPFNFGANWL